MTIIVLDGQGGGIGRAIIAALSPLLPQGAQLLCVGTNAMATAAMLKAGAQRGATGEKWLPPSVPAAPHASSCRPSAAARTSPGRTGSACSRWWKTPPDKRRRSPPRRKLWLFCITFGLTLRSHCLIMEKTQ